MDNRKNKKNKAGFQEFLTHNIHVTYTHIPLSLMGNVGTLLGTNISHIIIPFKRYALEDAVPFSPVGYV